MSLRSAVELRFADGDRVRTLVVRRHPAARGMKLRIDRRSGDPVLTLAPRASLGAALQWAESKRGWVEAALAGRPRGVRIGPGSQIPWRGAALHIDWHPDHGRAPVRAGETLMVGGPEALTEPRVLRWLKSEARAAMLDDAAMFCRRAGCAPGRISFGDPVSRWGSCSASGAIRLSWRLIMAPEDVRRSVVAHEIAHRRHHDHSREFHAHHQAILGADPAPARRWLNRHGLMLQLVGVAGG